MLATAAAPIRLTASAQWMHILHAPIRRDAPALDRIHVIEQHTWCIERPAFGDQLLVRRLRIAGLVRGAALQRGRRSVPHPGETESRLADRQRRILQRSEAPCLTAVGRDLHACDLAAPRSTACWPGLIPIRATWIPRASATCRR